MILSSWCRVPITLGLMLVAIALNGEELVRPVVVVEDTITVSFRDTPLEEVYEMLSRQARVNIVLGKDVTGEVSVNLYEVTLDEAIRLIADAAGYTAENRGGTYLIFEREDVGKDSVHGNTEIRNFKVQYTDPQVVADLLTKHLSRYGQITTLEDRNLLVAEDLPEFLDRLEKMLTKVDAQPRQILIVARILEITLDENQVYGIDWSLASGNLTFGTEGLAPTGISGFFLEFMSGDLEVQLNALSNEGRVRTLSTPKLLVLENQEAEVLIGDRTGFRVTTTINQVTTENIEFIESGVILKVKASVDQSQRIVLDVHPEVSNTTVSDGIPSQTTTEVTTQFVAEDGQKIFIGGLIKDSVTARRRGVPVLKDVPLFGNLFARTDDVVVNTETVVLIEPHIVDPDNRVVSEEYGERIESLETELRPKPAPTRINQGEFGASDSAASLPLTPVAATDYSESGVEIR